MTAWLAILRGVVIGCGVGMVLFGFARIVGGGADLWQWAAGVLGVASGAVILRRAWADPEDR